MELLNRCETPSHFSFQEFEVHQQKHAKAEVTTFEESFRAQLDTLQRQMLQESEELKQLQNSKKQLLICLTFGAVLHISFSRPAAHELTKLEELDQRNAEELKDFRAAKAHELEELETHFIKQLSTLRALYVEVCDCRMNLWVVTQRDFLGLNRNWI